MDVVPYDNRVGGRVRPFRDIAVAEVGRAALPYARQAAQEGVRLVAEGVTEGGRYIFKAVREMAKRKTRSKKKSSRSGVYAAGGGSGGGVYGKVRKRASKRKGRKKRTSKKVSKMPKKIANQFRTYGWQATYDFHDTFTGAQPQPNHIGVLGGTPASSVLFVICGAIWRKLYSLANGDIRNPIEGSGIGPFSVQIQYRLGRDEGVTGTNGLVSFTGGTIHADVIIGIRSTLCKIAASTTEKLFLYDIELNYHTGLANFRKKISLENAKMDLLMYANMSLQNRTLGAAAGDDQSTDVTANPLKYYHWKVKGNGIDLTSGYGSNRGVSVNAEGGVVTTDEYPNADQPLRKMDIKRSVAFKSGVINPGVVHTVYWKERKTIALDVIMWKFSDFLREADPAGTPVLLPDDVYAQVNLGYTNYVQFEKLMKSGGQKITVGIDSTTTLGARLFPGRKPVLNLLKYTT